MDKGQHLRLVIMSTAAAPVAQFVALATDLTVHFSAQTEDATTKDTTDTTGSWLVYDVTGRSGDIQFGALLAVNDGQAIAGSLYAGNFIDMVSDTEVDWQLLLTSGSQNRTKSKTICTGKGKLTNLQMTGQNRQNATYSGTLNMYGPVTVGTD
jgi:hypothetical protein